MKFANGLDNRMLTLIEQIRNLQDLLRDEGPVCRKDLLGVTGNVLQLAECIAGEIDDAMYAGAIEFCMSCNKIKPTEELVDSECEDCQRKTCWKCGGSGEGDGVLRSANSACILCDGRGRAK